VPSANIIPLSATSQICGQTILIVPPSSTSHALRTRRPVKVTARTVGIGPTARLGKASDATVNMLADHA